MTDIKEIKFFKEKNDTKRVTDMSLHYGGASKYNGVCTPDDCGEDNKDS